MSTSSSTTTGTGGKPAIQATPTGKKSPGTDVYQPCLRKRSGGKSGAQEHVPSSVTTIKTAASAQSLSAPQPSVPTTPLSQARVQASSSSSSSSSAIPEESEDMQLAMAVFIQCVLPHTQNISYEEQQRTKKFSSAEIQQWIVDKILNSNTSPSSSSSSSSTSFHSIAFSCEKLQSYATLLVKIQEGEVKIHELEAFIEMLKADHESNINDQIEVKEANQRALGEVQKALLAHENTIAQLTQALQEEQRKAAAAGAPPSEAAQRKIADLEERLRQTNQLYEEYRKTTASILEANAQNLKSVEGKLAEYQANIDHLTRTLATEVEASQELRLQVGNNSALFQKVSEVTRRVYNNLCNPQNSNTQVAVANATRELGELIGCVDGKPPVQINSKENPLAKAQELVGLVQALQTRSGTLIDDLEAKIRLKDKKNMVGFPEQLATLIADAGKVQLLVEGTAEQLKDTILDCNREKVSTEDIETVARALGTPASLIETNLKAARKEHRTQIATLGELTTRWFGMVQKLNEAACKFNEEMEGFVDDNEKMSLIGMGLQKVSNSIITLVTICNPVLKIRQNLITLAIDCESSAITCTGVTWRLIRKSLTDMYNVSCNDTVLFETYMKKLNETYQQEKTALLALTSRGDRILPLINDLIRDLDEKVAIGTANENIPDTALKCFAFVQKQPLDEVTRMFDDFRIENKDRVGMSSLLQLKRTQYEAAWLVTKREASRTYDATKQNGVYMSESRFNGAKDSSWLNPMAWVAPYVDPELRSPFDPKPVVVQEQSGVAKPAESSEGQDAAA